MPKKKEQPTGQPTGDFEVGQRIKEVREFYGYSQAQLAEKASLSPRFIAFVESGKKDMSSKSIKQIASALRVSTDYLLYGSEKDTIFVEQALMTLNEEEQRTMKKYFSNGIRIMDEIPKEKEEEKK